MTILCLTKILGFVEEYLKWNEILQKKHQPVILFIKVLTLFQVKKASNGLSTHILPGSIKSVEFLCVTTNPDKEVKAATATKKCLLFLYERKMCNGTD